MKLYRHGPAKGMAIHPQPGEKLCTVCLESMPLELFYRDRGSPDGRTRFCKVCRMREKEEHCLDCPMPKENGKSRCERCRAKHNARGRIPMTQWRSYRRRRKAGFLASRATRETTR